MSVANTNSSVTYAGDDDTQAFTTTFKFLGQTDLTVELSNDGGTTWSTLVLGSDYSVAGVGADEPGGTVTLVAAALLGNQKLRITRNTPMVQPVALQQSGSYPPRAIATEMDRLTLICQELARRVAALEAGSVGSTYTAVRVTDTFTVADPAESTWPRTVATGVAPATAVIGRIENLTTGTEVLYGPGDLAWQPSGFNLSVKNIAGLTVGQQYRVTYEVRS